MLRCMATSLELPIVTLKDGIKVAGYGTLSPVFLWWELRIIESRLVHEIKWHCMICQPKRFSMKVIFGAKSAAKNGLYHFYPSAKDRREKINGLQAIIFDKESANDAQKFLAPPKRKLLPKMWTPICFGKETSKHFWGDGK